MSKYLLAAAALIALFVQSSFAVITVISNVEQIGNAIRAQAVIDNPTSFDRGESFTAVSIKQFIGNVIIRDDVAPPDQRGGLPLLVNKTNLTNGQTWGSGLPMGYDGPPITDPTGPWQGLTWPYRDQFDYFPNEFDPLGNDVGTPFFDSPDVYGFLNITAIARGGPTDPVPPPGSSSEAWLQRGLTGNGLGGPATYFLFNILAQSGDPNRFVRLRVIGASAIVVQKNSQNEFSEILVPVPDFEKYIQLPEPATLALLPLAGLLLMRRRT